MKIRIKDGRSVGGYVSFADLDGKGARIVVTPGVYHYLTAVDESLGGRDSVKYLVLVDANYATFGGRDLYVPFAEHPDLNQLPTLGPDCDFTFEGIERD